MKIVVSTLIILPLLCCVAQPVKYAATEKISPLSQVYNQYFPIGTAINPDADLVSDTRKNFIAYQYNSITPENQMKPKQIHPEENRWNWAPADRIIEFARENSLRVRGHALVWQQNIPSWMIWQNGKLAGKEVLLTKMKKHITELIGRYKQYVYCWDVVNEAVSDNAAELYRAKDTLNMIAGEEYVEMAFRYAHEADSTAQLFYNDYRFSDPVKRKKIYDLMKRLLDKGVPVHGIGIQSHYIPNEVSETYLQETIDMFAGLGLKIQVTELDVSIYNYRDKNSPDADKKDDRYTAERKQVQEAFYRMLFNVYRKNKDVITGVTFWGASDLRKNYRTARIGKMDYPFLFDENLQPKNTYYQVVQF